MSKTHDRLECRRCGMFWHPEFTVTGRVINHCPMPVEEVVMSVEWYDGEVELDFEAIERRVLKDMGLTDVVEPPLTVFSEKRRGWMGRGLIIFGAIFIVLIVLFGNIGAAKGACIMSYCQENAPERSYVRNNWNNGRQIIGDRYDPGHGRPIQIRNNSRQITGYIDAYNRVLDPYRRVKETIDADR